MKANNIIDSLAMPTVPDPLEGGFRVLSEHKVLPCTKCSVAQHHLQLHWKCLRNLAALLLLLGGG